jgi:hypothetical protein
VLPSSQEHLLLKDKPHQMKGPMIQVLKDVKLLPLRSKDANECEDQQVRGGHMCQVHYGHTPSSF